MREQQEIQNSYDRVAEEYAAAFFKELEQKPFDRELLDRFAERVGRQGQVWDIGCGPGHVAGYLYAHGIDVCGLDLSPQMVACAQKLNPDIPFRQGTMLALPLPAHTLRGIVSFYAIIHLGREEAQQALQEFARVLQPGGFLLLSCHRGEGELHNEEWFGRPVTIDVTLFEGDEIERYTRQAGFVDIEIRETHRVGEHARSAIVRARKPA